MAKRGELFDSERQPEGDAQCPLGRVENNETLVRGIPPASPGEQRRDQGEVPRATFKREELSRGASVTRHDHNSMGIETQLEGHTSAYANVKDIRDQVDTNSNRLWSVVAAPENGNTAHAHIYREPKGTIPSRPERNQFLKLWRKGQSNESRVFRRICG